MSRTATTIVDGKRRRTVATRVYEQGRRVHGWHLTHDLVVNVLGNFPAFWEQAQADGERRRAASEGGPE